MPHPPRRGCGWYCQQAVGCKIPTLLSFGLSVVGQIVFRTVWLHNLPMACPNSSSVAVDYKYDLFSHFKAFEAWITFVCIWSLGSYFLDLGQPDLELNPTWPNPTLNQPDFFQNNVFTTNLLDQQITNPNLKWPNSSQIRPKILWNSRWPKIDQMKWTICQRESVRDR